MIRRTVTLLLCLMLAGLFLLPAAAPAENTGKVIRVGWYETPFNRKDAFGRRTGYAYEYQRKIAAYTGWKYEYIEGTWPELLQMLLDGRIDLMSDVSYTAERARKILYASMPMGEELYYLYVSPDSTAISATDVSTLNGKKVGVTGSSVQKNLFLRWAEEQGVAVELQEMDCSEAESLTLMKKGGLDAFVTLDSYGDPGLAVPVWKIGSSDFYFALSKNRADLLDDLNTALSRIQDENRHYNDQLSEKYFRNTGTNLYLTEAELEWLDQKGPIRVGYQDNYLAFCAADPKTGELTGALKDYLSLASETLANARPEFTAIAYPTAAAAMVALRKGEVDCMFPANLSDYDGEIAGVVLSPPLMTTEMDAVVRAEDQQDFLRMNQVRVGINQGNPNYEVFLQEHFPGWTPVLYPDTSACLEAVAARNTDCIIISNYRYRDIAPQCNRLNLTTVYTGVDMDYCFAIREGDTTLYSVLSRIINQMPESSVNAALTYYSAEPAGTGTSLPDYLRNYPVVTVCCGAMILLIAVLLIRIAQLKKKRR